MIDQATLDTCASEPIHIPGSIQPHGALLAFDRTGSLVAMSANANAMLGLALRPGTIPGPGGLGGSEGPAWPAIREALAALAAGEPMPDSRELVLSGRPFDLVIHAHEGLCLCEFELREADGVGRFAQLAYRAMDKLRHQPSIERLLDTAVAELRALTGFDRVMAYRFRHDDSGDIVAEARRASLESYLGRRYPASDIPAQARRLYLLNTLRLIADVGDQPVPLLAAPDRTAPLDLSHSVLRSVSPVHIEYLRNMGVAASMSMSIVVGGRLWGMLACHHMAPLRVPFPIRMAADVIAQLLAAQAQTLAAREREAAMAEAALLRSEIGAQIGQGHEAGDVLTREAAPLCASLDCEALVVAIDGRLRCHGPVDEHWAAALVETLQQRERALVHIELESELPLQPEPARWCGALGLRFDGPRRGWLVALRPEQIQTIRWGGKPEKVIAHGPLGPRLTPRGSFDEWRETVRGTAVPWSATQLESAALLLDAVSRAHAGRVLELDRLRSQLWAVLGHDLRDPLHTLSVASFALDRQHAAERISTVIRTSTNRMQRLLRDLQDITRIQNGLGLSIEPEATDLAALLGQLLRDQRAAYPDMQLDATLPEALPVTVDPQRYVQMAANLLSNARHHGKGRIRIELARVGDERVHLRVANPAEPIAQELVEGLFDPFKRSSLEHRNARNPGSMGLGLYIVHQIAAAQGGSVRYEARNGEVIFELELPLPQV
ncbi:GAF domain-containing protein [Pelomonas sp. KK5]|uniref:GAF domain-containing protein n=1 Tax=Pelomonas sp. KK5 TaxID=1855730 RepID=UPI00097BF61B|nr:GAF domain-containing protein [Pelomonas sp. KK5]